MYEVNRRRFLGLTASVAAASLAQSLLTHEAFAVPSQLPPGIQLYAVREPLTADTRGTLQSLHKIGFREVESAGFGRYSATEFGRMIHDVGLRCPSAHLPFNTATDLGPLFADAHALGAEYATSSVLRMVSAPGSNTPLPPLGLDGFQKAAARMNEIGRAAKAAGLQYAYHNHNFEFERMPDGSFGYDLLLTQTDSSLVKFELDCGWMISAGAKPTDYFTRYPGRFRMLHVKDFQPLLSPTIQLRGPGRPVGVELGRGFIDYKPIFAAASSAGIEHAFAEQEGPYLRPQLESAKVSYNYLESLR